MRESHSKKSLAAVSSDWRACRALCLATRLMVAGAASIPLPASANAALEPGQTFTGDYRCGAITGRATVQVTRLEPLTERPGWQRIEATLTFEEKGHRGVARFAGNNPHPLRSDAFVLGFQGWAEQPVGVEFQRLRLQPGRTLTGDVRIGVNPLGRQDCIVNGIDTFSFWAHLVRPARTAPAGVSRPDTGQMNDRTRAQQDALEDMQRADEAHRSRMEEDRRRLEEQHRAEREAIERGNEIRRQQVEQWEAEERRRRGW